MSGQIRLGHHFFINDFSPEFEIVFTHILHLDDSNS